MTDYPSVAIQPGILDERSPGLMALVERFDAIPVEALLVYLIDDVDATVLPYLVEQFDMGDFIRETTSETATRAMLKQAIDLKRHLGTPWALKFVAQAVGLPIELIDWHEADPQLPRHTFIARAWLNDATTVADADAQAELARLISVAKRFSQHETIQMALGTSGDLALGGGLDTAPEIEFEGGGAAREHIATDLRLNGALDAGPALDLDGPASARNTAPGDVGLAGAFDNAQLMEFRGHA